MVTITMAIFAGFAIPLMIFFWLFPEGGRNIRYWWFGFRIFYELFLRIRLFLTRKDRKIFELEKQIEEYKKREYRHDNFQYLFREIFDGIESLSICQIQSHLSRIRSDAQHGGPSVRRDIAKNLVDKLLPVILDNSSNEDEKKLKMLSMFRDNYPSAWD